MIHITNLDDGLELFKALGSDVRVQILNVLLENKNMTMNQLASELNISNGALTGHMKKLEECGLVSTTGESNGHGNSKLCSLLQDKIVIDIEGPEASGDYFSTDIRVGQFSKYSVTPTCGLASNSAVIGEFDDPRYFDHPDRFNADILWFTKGFIEYTLPNLIPANTEIDELQISCELCSEAPGVNNNWPSDISFFINDVCLGQWTSPGDFGENERGILNPDWWSSDLNQYGLLKMLVVNKEGSFIDGNKISDVSTKTLKLDYKTSIRFKISVNDDSNHIGGVTLFGKSFGNYGQDIRVRIGYNEMDAK